MTVDARGIPGETAGTLTLRRLEDRDAARWDEYVTGCAQASFFHRAGWRRVLERAFGHDTYYYYVESQGRIRGVLPLGHIRSRLFGNALISVPFCVCGGAAADDAEAAAMLEHAAEDLARRLGADYLELRYREPRAGTRPVKQLYVGFRKPIDPDPEKNLLAIPRKQRAMVRKGIDAGLTSEVDTGVERFFDAYAESVRNLGTPVFSKKYFRCLKEEFGDDCEVLTVTRDGAVVASVMSFYFRDEVLPYYGGGTAAARRVAGNDFMYWELMRRACGRGVRVFDFGRSKQGTGAYSFKKNWGFSPEPLHYEYLLVKAKSVPEVNPLNPRYRLMIAAWRRLPLPVSKLIGPWIARSLG
jgi:FemAB-related protein (PEP-CTERM system-associated)